MRRFAAYLLAVLCALVAAPVAAEAASLVYVDGGNDVAVARPDGSDQRKVTHASDSAHGYKAISVADDGGITAYLNQGDGSGNSSFVVLDQSGAIRSGPFLFERDGICGGLSPFRTATSPDGTFVAVQYWKGSNNCLGGSYTPSVRLTNRNSPTFGTSTYPSYDYLTQPGWTHHPDQRLAGINGTALQVWQNDAAHMQDWITVSGGLELDGFDFHPTATMLLLDLADASVTGSKPHTLALLTYTELSTGAAAPTDPKPQLVCTVEGYVTNDLGGGRPVWSPDGAQIAWNGPGGIYVSPAPVPNGPSCLLQPRLVVPGGSDVHWAAFDLAQPGSGDSTTPPAAAGTATTPSGGGATKKGGVAKGSPSAPTFSGAKVVAAQGALTVQLKLQQAATVRIAISRQGAKKPLGTLTYKAKQGPFVRKIVKVGGKRLQPGPYRVAIKVGATTKALSVRLAGK
ncbi:MAG: hypothetical protein BGO11_16090 [Solirubrobacterales bacterium 70-9]|nr:MAG: hypothetical protein BGO11_16090 [Solirubrobacterales bacterium 70-9]